MNAPIMLRRAPRILARQHAPILRPLPTRRLLNTAPPAKTSRSWKNSAARWTLALGIVYWYNTTTFFTEDAAYPMSQPLSSTDEASLPSLESIAQSREKQKQELSTKPSSIYPSSSPSTSSPTTSDSPQSQPPPPSPEDAENAAAVNPLASTEEEAHSQGAFNEETGEINWDCPCLGGMAHGPCGPEFREAFSCFVHSTDEPKGMECIDKFKGMQDCFRAHPEEYGDELAREEEEAEVEGAVLDGRKEEEEAVLARKAANGGEVVGGEEKKKEDDESVGERVKGSVEKAKSPLPGDEGGDLVPKASHDAR